MSWSFEHLEEAVRVWRAPVSVKQGFYDAVVRRMSLQGPEVLAAARIETPEDMYGFHRWRFGLRPRSDVARVLLVEVRLDATVSYDAEVVFVHEIRSILPTDG